MTVRKVGLDIVAIELAPYIVLIAQITKMESVPHASQVGMVQIVKSGAVPTVVLETMVAIFTVIKPQGLVKMDASQGLMVLIVTYLVIQTVNLMYVIGKQVIVQQVVLKIISVQCVSSLVQKIADM